MKTILPLSLAEKAELDKGFLEAFGSTPVRYFSAPGRTEISGNHTDHQRGCVLAAAVDLHTRAAVKPNGSDRIRIQSKGYPLVEIMLTDLTPMEAEKNTTAALIRGVAARFSQLGCKVGGFDAYVESSVLPGSGLSSSAAFEVLVGTVINHLFFDGKATQPEVAQIGQYAENVFFGKPSGLMDQMASAVGGMVHIDFKDKEDPVITPLDFDFAETGYALCIIDSGADHADLTDEYAAIPREMQAVCRYFGKEVLREVSEEEFYVNLPALRETCGDRAVLRCVHIFAENRRVAKQKAALQNGDFEAFLQLVKESGRSSWVYLQNVLTTGATANQAVAVALALCEKYLQGRGAYRVHGGGFAGTVQAFVPVDMVEGFRENVEKALGKGACHILSVRPQGGVEMLENC
ncbi:MAG: galactokinase [Oscillospiraceae bacterium]|nr:galactokinase [Oscillospiraceae bacterium]